MISHLSGTLTKKHEQRQAVEMAVNGVGYEVLLPTFVWRALEETPVGEQLELEIYYHVPERQPTPMLVGFSRDVEREFFKKLVEVPDLGPMKAIRALVYSVSTIATWIEQGDERSLRSLPGVGERLAKTMVAHLKGKVIEDALLQDEHFAEPPAKGGPPSLSEVQQLAVAGLVRLGYKEGEASRWVEDVTNEEEPAEVEEVIRAVFARRSQELE
ncbi:MAG: Holliday junction branch migration protein RuvA [Dehalococcoidia bacterium]|nr:Holliday junction branch migration protein RuvA [Dehalococcoidia bacterium]